MNTTHAPLPGIGLAAALLLAACGGGPGAPGVTAGPGATSPGAGPAGSPGAGTTTQPPGGAATQTTGGPGGSPAAGVTDAACTMLTAADIEAVTGATLVTTIPTQQLGIFPNGCLFELSGGGMTTSVNLGVMTSGGRAYFDSEIAPTNPQPIQGLGDIAVNAGLGSVMVVAGDVLVSIQYFGTSGPDQVTGAEFARRVLTNLGL